MFITKTAADYRPALLLVSDETRTITGTLYEYEEDYGNYYYTLNNVSVNGNKIEHKIRICTQIYKNTEIDDNLTFTDATIYELGAANNNQNTYKANGIYLGAYTNSDFSVVKAETHTANYYFEFLRQYITNRLSINMNPRYASIADAMLTGNQADLDNDILMNFRYSGISHLFAVSGFHLSLWTSALSIIIDKIIKKKKYLGNIICIIFVIFFMALAGFAKSVVRAGIMMLIFLFGKIIKYQSEPLNSLFIAVTVILLTNPFAVMSLSLQMSFLSTLGILILSSSMTEPVYNLQQKIKSKHIYNIISAVYITVIISVIASLFTMPVSALNFGYISAAAPLTNLLCMFPAQIVIILSGLEVITSGVAFISKPISFFMTILLRYLVFITDKIASLKNCVIDTSSPFIKAVIITITVIMAMFLIIFRKDNKKLRCTLFSSAVTVVIICICTLFVQSSTIKITVADVGNGSSIILQNGQSKAVLSCGGSDYKSYKLTDNASPGISDNFDLLLIPRNTNTENGYAYKMLNKYTFKNCIVSDDNYPDYITELMPENTVFTDACTIRLDERTTLKYNNSDTFSGLRIESDNFTCTVLFLPNSDFSSVPEDWQKGSLLITRQTVPNIDLSNFENIIISSDKEIIYDNNNIYTTKYGGMTTYRMYTTGVSVVTEENNDYK